MPLFYLTAVCGSLSVLLFCEWIGDNAPILREYGKRTITCLAFHRFIISIAALAGGVLSLNRTLTDVLAVAASIAVIFPIHSFLESYLPNLIGKR